jgi:hypothetical protein
MHYGPRFIASAPSGFPAPPAIQHGRSCRRSIHLWQGQPNPAIAFESDPLHAALGKAVTADADAVTDGRVGLSTK